MNEKIYLIQFDYGGKTHSIHNLSHHDFKKGVIGDKLWVYEMIELYLESNNLRNGGDKVTNVRLIADGDVQFSLKDFTDIENNG